MEVDSFTSHSLPVSMKGPEVDNVFTFFFSFFFFFFFFFFLTKEKHLLASYEWALPSVVRDYIMSVYVAVFPW